MLFDSDAGDALAVADLPTWLLLAMCCRRRCDVDVVIVDDGTRTRTSQKRGMAARDPPATPREHTVGARAEYPSFCTCSPRLGGVEEWHPGTVSAALVIVAV